MKVTAELKVVEWKSGKGHGKSWNFDSLKEYKPCRNIII